MKRVPELRESDKPLHVAPAPRPGDGLDPETAAPDAAEMLAGKHKADAVDIFRRLIAECLPINRVYKGRRSWDAAVRRMVAIAYCVSPEQFVGMKQAAVARFLGITPRVFKRLLAETREQLAGR